MRRTAAQVMVVLTLQPQIVLDETRAPTIAHARIERRPASSSPNRTTSDTAMRTATNAATANPATARTFPIVEGRVVTPVRLSNRHPMNYQRTGIKNAAVVCAANSRDAPLWNRESKGTSISMEANTAGALIRELTVLPRKGDCRSRSGPSNRRRAGRGVIQFCNWLCHVGR